MALPAVDCFLGLPPEERWRAIYEALLAINTNTGGSSGSDEFESTPSLVTSSGSIPAGVLGWSFTVVSGTVTLNGSALPVGASLSSGGYGNKTLKTAIPYTISGGSVILLLDTPE